MQYVSRLGVRKRFTRLAALTAAAMFVIPAAAFASSCPARATTTPFTQWGDNGSYFLAPGGDFSSPLSASGWTVAGAERTLGGQPFNVGIPSDYSLTINGGGVAISPAFCIDDSMPYFRFFTRALGADGNLQVRLVVQTSRGSITTPVTHVAHLAANAMADWAPTAQFDLADGVSMAAGQAAIARLVFNATGPSSWQVDDIFVDPYRTG
jgi:hypothetical protein